MLAAIMKIFILKATVIVHRGDRTLCMYQLRKHDRPTPVLSSPEARCPDTQVYVWAQMNINAARGPLKLS